MGGRMGRWLLTAISCVALVGVEGCAAKANAPEQWITPQATRIELKGPCKLDRNGKPSKGCVTLWHINAVQVKK
jgi:hypothetical protein